MTVQISVLIRLDNVLLRCVLFVFRFLRTFVRTLFKIISKNEEWPLFFLGKLDLVVLLAATIYIYVYTRIIVYNKYKMYSIYRYRYRYRYRY